MKLSEKTKLFALERWVVTDLTGKYWIIFDTSPLPTHFENQIHHTRDEV